MTVLLTLATILVWGSWVPASQAVRGVGQRSKVMYVAFGNLVIATIALVVGGGGVSAGWKQFWLPALGGVVWVGGNYTAFLASDKIGLARANGTWAPLNIIVGFAWGAALFGELDRLAAWRFAALGLALVPVVVGVLLIVGSQESQGTASKRADYAQGLLYAGAAGVLWGTYFIPAQWAHVPAQVGNFPLAVGILAGSLLLVATGGGPDRARPPAAGVLLASGVLFGVGNVTLLSLVARVGTGVGFTLAQLSLLVSASIGIFVFKVPRPGTPAVTRVVTGILLAGLGGVVIGALK